MRPTGRTDHTAVWTGSEMIVWGGVGNHSDYFEHRRADTIPSTDTWTATSTTNAPDCPNVSHGSLDRQRNDRLGRIQTAISVLNTGGRYCAQSGCANVRPPTATAYCNASYVQHRLPQLTPITLHPTSTPRPSTRRRDLGARRPRPRPTPAPRP